MNHLRKLKTKPLLDNISTNLFIKLITYLFSFLTVVYSRTLQPEAYGRASFVSSYVGYFLMIASLGMPIYAMRRCAEERKNKERLEQTVSELWSIGLVLSVICSAALLLTIFLVPKLQENRTLHLIYGTGILLQAFSFEWYFKGMERFRFLAGSQLICKVVSLLCMILFVHSSDQLPLYAILAVFVSHGSSIVYFAVVKGRIKLHFHLNSEHLRPLLLSMTREPNTCRI